MQNHKFIGALSVLVGLSIWIGEFLNFSDLFKENMSVFGGGILIGLGFGIYIIGLSESKLSDKIKKLEDNVKKGLYPTKKVRDIRLNSLLRVRDVLESQLDDDQKKAKNKRMLRTQEKKVIQSLAKINYELDIIRRINKLEVM